MRLFIILIAFSLFAIPGCKTRDKAIKQTNVSVVPIGTTLGKVSHQFRETGCATVVIVSKDGQEDLTLIPVDTLPKEYDTNGLEIYFNYRLLKVKNPVGCHVGIPARLSDISKKVADCK
jgi:hypothetical protein